MTDREEPPALAYIEKTLAESYRKEIDQEENVWRSLPFFAATLALQLAALFQMIDKLADPGTVGGKFSVIFLVLAGLFTLVSLFFLAASIYPQTFDYVAQETALLAYAQKLIKDEQEPCTQGQAGHLSALVTLKTELADQYAKGAEHNREINERRELLRSIAGLAALSSVVMTVLLVATTYVHYLYAPVERDAGNGPGQNISAERAPVDLRLNPFGKYLHPEGTGPATHAGRH